MNGCPRCPSTRKHRAMQECIDYLNARVGVLEAVQNNEALTVHDALLHPAAEERFRIQQATQRYRDEPCK